MLIPTSTFTNWIELVTTLIPKNILDGLETKITQEIRIVVHFVKEATTRT